MSHCINKANVEYQKLLKYSGLKDAILSAKIAIWQEANNKLDSFPTLGELLPDNSKSTSVPFQKVAPKFSLQESLKKQYIEEGLIDARGNVKDYPKMLVRNREITQELAAAHNIQIDLRERVYTLSGQNNQKATLNHSFLNKINQIFSVESRVKNNLKEIVNKNKAENIVDSTQSKRESAQEIILSVSDKYFKGNQQAKSSEVLEEISKSSNALNKLAKKLLEYSVLNNVDIKLVESIESIGEINNPSGVYIPKTNEILINKNANYRGTVESIILHEIIHSLTMRTIKGNSSAVKDLKALMEYAKKSLPPYDAKTNTGTYALHNIDEFLVALFTNASFINQLLKIPSTNNKKYSNLFEEVFDYILGLFKINKDDSLYTDAFAVATNILEEFKKSTEAANDYNQFLDISLVSTQQNSPKLKEYFKEVEQTPEVTRIIKEIDKSLPQYPIQNIESLVNTLAEVPEFNQDLKDTSGTRFPYVNLHKEVSTALLQAKGLIPNTEDFYTAMEMFGYENKPFIFAENVEQTDEVYLENLLQDIKKGLPDTPILRPEFRTYFNPPLLLKRAQFPLETTQKYVSSFNNIQETLGEKTFSNLENYKDYSKDEWSGILLYALEQALRQDIPVSTETIEKIKDFIQDRYEISYDTIVQYNNTSDIWEVAENLDQFIKFKKEYSHPENTEELIKDFREFARLEQANVKIECL